MPEFNDQNARTKAKFDAMVAQGVFGLPCDNRMIANLEQKIDRRAARQTTKSLHFSERVERKLSTNQTVGILGIIAVTLVGATIASRMTPDKNILARRDLYIQSNNAGFDPQHKAFDPLSKELHFDQSYGSCTLSVSAGRIMLRDTVGKPYRATQFNVDLPTSIFPVVVVHDYGQLHSTVYAEACRMDT